MQFQTEEKFIVWSIFLLDIAVTPRGLHKKNDTWNLVGPFWIIYLGT